jgi:K+-sensing histidine kinase KdpD
MQAFLTNNPSPRPGFTYVAQAHHRRQVAPVVAVVSQDPASMVVLRKAVLEASLRSTELHVVSVGDSEGSMSPAHAEAVEQAGIVSALEHSNVVIAHVDLSDRSRDVADYCASVHASLLVVDSSLFATLGSASEGQPDIDAVAGCDILVVAPSQEESELVPVP